MNFNSHLNLAGSHAILSPSNYHWINYDEDKLDRIFFTRMEAQRGVELHDLAHNLIRLGIKLPDTLKTLNMYVNDGIGFRMKTEQIFYYSDNCYGHADTAIFTDNFLRIHDLKTGVNEASEHQLEVYAALFCLEYRYKPFAIKIELRIYQNDEVRIYEPEPDVIFHIMDKIVTFDKRLNLLRLEAQ